MNFIKNQDPELYSTLIGEQNRQESELELIASENIVSKAVLEANGSIFTNKYSEGYPGNRYYGGQKYTDIIEGIAIDRAKKLFGAEHVNVQPHSGSPANLAIFFALLNEGDTILGMDLSHGGHLTHGHPLNYSGKKFNIISYWVEPSTEIIDMANVGELAKKHKPKMIIAGFSAYSRDIDWKQFRQIADSVGAILMADISHIAGLVAGKILENPIPYCDVVMTTTHKTLRGPRGAMIMCREKFAKQIDKAVFPGIQGWPHEHTIFAKAIAFGEALKPEFSTYVRQIVDNSKIMAKVFLEEWIRVISWGTDNHMILLDVFGSVGVTGKEAERIFENIGISTNKNMIPFDKRKPLDPSGIRIGTPSITSRGFMEWDCKKLAKIMASSLKNYNNPDIQKQCKEEIKKYCQKFPIPESF